MRPHKPYAGCPDDVAKEASRSGGYARPPRWLQCSSAPAGLVLLVRLTPARASPVSERFSDYRDAAS
jgi:hypothetical protein